MPPQRNVDIDLFTEYNRRLKELEDALARLTNRFWLRRGASGDFPWRIVWGSIYNDGNTNQVGSEDWTCEETGGLFTVTIDPPFPTNNLSLQATPNNNLAVNESGRYGVSSYSGPTTDTVYFLTSDFDDADMVDPEGGFDFLIVGEQ